MHYQKSCSALQAQTQTQFATQTKPLTYFQQNTLHKIFGLGLLANLKHKHKLQLKQKTPLISNKIFALISASMKKSRGEDGPGLGEK